MKTLKNLAEFAAKLMVVYEFKDIYGYEPAPGVYHRYIDELDAVDDIDEPNVIWLKFKSSTLYIELDEGAWAEEPNLWEMYEEEESSLIFRMDLVLLEDYAGERFFSAEGTIPEIGEELELFAQQL